jgi:hypothetical protein
VSDKPLTNDITHGHLAWLIFAHIRQANVPDDIAHQRAMLENVTFFVLRVTPTPRDSRGRDQVIAFQDHIQRLEKWVHHLEIGRNL